MGQVNAGVKAFTTGAAVSKFRFVKLDSSGNVVHCNYGDTPIGVSQEAGASGDIISVALLNSQGTLKVAAEGIITAPNHSGVPTYGGMLSVSILSGINFTKMPFSVLESSTGQNGIVEILVKY